MTDHHTSQHLHVNLVGTDTRNCHLVQHPQEICFNGRLQNFQKSTNVFGITDDILVVGYDSDGKDHDEML